MPKIEPITLTGKLVRLEPLQMKHAAELYQAAKDHPDIWTYMPLNPIRSLADMEQVIAKACQKQEEGTSLPFAIIDLAHNRAVGSTRYLDIQPAHRGLEIGWTWLSPLVQRTGINTECKYVLSQYAFETWGAIRVQLKTHHLNLKSQRAIERLGAVKEGTLRNHVIMPDGSYRHSVYYSIIDSEWPVVKAGLEAKMQRPKAGL
ncbi:MAG: GNAT family N-acetyltransferase [Ktedonobacteraceae bacterium]|nr:GNAT family N-acetyltransferase [Ktedonobacteraceae bacterium]